MKRKIMIMIVLAFLLVLIGYGLYSMQLFHKPAPKEEKKETDVIDTSQYMKDNYKRLMEIGEDLYLHKEKDYQIPLYRTEEGAYFITVNQLAGHFHYDIDSFRGQVGKPCDLEQTGIYIDPDHKLKVTYDKKNIPVVVVFIGCDYQKSS